MRNKTIIEKYVRKYIIDSTLGKKLFTNVTIYESFTHCSLKHEAKYFLPIKKTNR